MTTHRIGYTLWPANFNLIDPGRLLDEAEALGVDIVEIPFFATRLIGDNRPLEPAMRIFETAMQGRELGYTTHALLSINLMDEPELLARHEAAAQACIEVSARFGAEHMVLHCGLTRETAPDALDAAYARQREALARLGEAAAEHKLRICVETIWNFDDRETALPSRLAAEIRQVDHPFVRATLDFAHTALQCELKGADLLDEVAQIAPLSHHLHLNDCFATVREGPINLPAEALAYGHGDLHLPIGWGGLDWDRLLGEPDYPGRPILNSELHPTYWQVLGEEVEQMRRLAALMAQRLESE